MVKISNQKGDETVARYKNAKWLIAFVALCVSSLLLAYVAVILSANISIGLAIFFAAMLFLAPLYLSLRSIGKMLGRMGSNIRTVSKEQRTLQSQISYANDKIAAGTSASSRISSEIANVSKSVDVVKYKVDSTQALIGNNARHQKANSPVPAKIDLELFESATPVRQPRVTNPNKYTKRVAPKSMSGNHALNWATQRQRGNYFMASGYDWERLGPPTAREVPVAIIADDFTFNSFKNEFDITRLHPARWREQMEAAKPAVFICESAWQGGSPTSRPWQAKIYASVRWPKENRTILLQILDYCHKRGIPTVFWNKEDPVHFDDRINDFVRTAILFDHVFTTAEECVDAYRKQAGALSVGSLKFAVQPGIFHPIGREGAEDKAVFAGTWYGNYPDRCRVAEVMLDAVLKSGRSLDIYNRMYDSTEPRHQYPTRFNPYIKPPIPFAKTAEAYRGATFGLTLNTVTNSRTMFARRAYEISAAGGVVLSNTAQGIKDQFEDSVIYLDQQPEALQYLTTGDYRKYQHAGLSVSVKNTYTHRAEEILRAVGVQFESVVGRADLVAIPESPQEVHAYLRAWDERPSSMQHLLLIIDHLLVGSRLAEFGGSRRPDVTVVSLRSVKEGLRPQSYLRSPYAVVLEGPDHIGAIDIDYVTGCLQFPERILHLAGEADKRFRRNLVYKPAGCAVRGKDLADLLSAPFPLPVFEI